MARDTSARRRSVIEMPYSLKMNLSSGFARCGVGTFDKERTQAFSLSYWVKDTGVSTCAHLSLLVVAPQVRGMEITGTAGVLDFVMCSTGAALMRRRMTARLQPNVWTHLVITYDGSSLGAGALWYKNGVLAASTTITDALSGVVAGGGGQFSIGDRAAAGLPFRGNITRVRGHSRVLTAAEIETLYNDDVAVAVEEEWLMTDGTGTTLTASVGGHNGTVTTPVWSTDTPSHTRLTSTARDTSSARDVSA